MTSPELARQYLMDYLKDEFRKVPVVRIRIPPENQEDGVVLKTESREYFFPTDWVIDRKMTQVEAQVRRIKDVLGIFDQ